MLPNAQTPQAPMAQMPKDEPLKEFRITKRWKIEDGEFVYLVEQRFKNIRFDKQEEVETLYYRPLAEVSEDIAKKNADHYGIDMPTDEHDAFAEAEAMLAEAKKKGIVNG